MGVSIALVGMVVSVEVFISSARAGNDVNEANSKATDSWASLRPFLSIVIGPAGLDAVGGCHLVIVWLIRSAVNTFRSLLYTVLFVQYSMAGLVHGARQSVRLNFPGATYKSKYQYSGKGNRTERYPRERFRWATCEQGVDCGTSAL